MFFLITPAAEAKDVYRVTSHGGPPVKIDLANPSNFAQSSVPTKRIKGGDTLFNITYLDVEMSTGVGFDDPVDGATRQATAEAVLLYIADVLNENTGATLDVIFIESLTDGSFLAGGGWGLLVDSEIGFVNGLAFDHITTGIDPADFVEDIFCTVDFGNNWNSDHTTLPGNDEYDLFTVLLHEITHSIGVWSVTQIDGASDAPNKRTVWDSHMRYNTNTIVFNPVTTALEVPATAFTSDNLSFGGPHARAAYGSQPPLYAPSLFNRLDHFEPGVPSVMTPDFAAGVAKREYSAVDIGALIDIGYTHAKPAGFSRDVVVDQTAGGGYVEEGRSVTLRVAFTGISGIATANWLHDNVAVANGGGVTTTFQQTGDRFVAELTIDSADPSHEGNYVVSGTDAAKGIFESPALTITVVAPGALPAQNAVVLGIAVTLLLIIGSHIIRNHRRA